jgi:hypothetical protein
MGDSPANTGSGDEPDADGGPADAFETTGSDAGTTALEERHEPSPEAPAADEPAPPGDDDRES